MRMLLCNSSCWLVVIGWDRKTEQSPYNAFFRERADETKGANSLRNTGVECIVHPCGVEKILCHLKTWTQIWSHAYSSRSSKSDTGELLQVKLLLTNLEIDEIRRAPVFSLFRQPPNTPNNPIDPFLSSLDRCLRRTNRLHEHYTLLAGDFNARNSCWYGGDTTDDAGENLHQLFSLFSLEQ